MDVFLFITVAAASVMEEPAAVIMKWRNALLTPWIEPWHSRALIISTRWSSGRWFACAEEQERWTGPCPYSSVLLPPPRPTAPPFTSPSPLKPLHSSPLSCGSGSCQFTVHCSVAVWSAVECVISVLHTRLSDHIVSYDSLWALWKQSALRPINKLISAT